jgi:uracil-DNA glycosylase family 4
VKEFNYKEYLASREWGLLKEQVRQRSGGICERCHRAPYQSTHHTTYERIGHELLTDLLGLCNECHSFVSGKSEVDPAAERARTTSQSLSTTLDVLQIQCRSQSLPDNLGELRTLAAQCTRCKLHRTRTHVVFGEGNPHTDLMFVGEGPGEDEDIQGEPFVGRAGKLLTNIIEAFGMKRSDVYITNVMKCRPPGNRCPEPDETNECLPFLFRQIEIIQPKVIVTLGKVAAQSLLSSTEPITRLRGREFTRGNVTIIPTYHPAYLLRTPAAKREVWDDMSLVKRLTSGGVKVTS